ncbi:hypothetical protein [Bailinhaonella thermotolerans]|uniref:hypothetical protein n=1 Tax=Bailinhaonella thermotolerans TaxID=1070861 RepID=UPI00192A54CD|nr:hypothetical protein [Bailinhaonella thermotolerans]
MNGGHKGGHRERLAIGAAVTAAAPEGWREAVVERTQLGNHARTSVTYRMEDGGTRAGEAFGLDEQFDQMREKAYVPGEGTWVSCRLEFAPGSRAYQGTLEPAGESDPFPAGAPPTAYVEELTFFPRRRIPAWLADALPTAPPIGFKNDPLPPEETHHETESAYHYETETPFRYETETHSDGLEAYVHLVATRTRPHVAYDAPAVIEIAPRPIPVALTAPEPEPWSGGPPMSHPAGIGPDETGPGGVFLSFATSAEHAGLVTTARRRDVPDPPEEEAASPWGEVSYEPLGHLTVTECDYRHDGRRRGLGLRGAERGDRFGVLGDGESGHLLVLGDHPHRGGLVSWNLHGDRLTLRLTAEAAAALDAETTVEITLALPPEEVGRVRRGLTELVGAAG